MRIANLTGRLVLLTESGAVDDPRGQPGQVGPDPMAVYNRVAQLHRWVDSTDLPAGRPYDKLQLERPGAGTPPGLRDRPELPRTRRRGRTSTIPTDLPDLHQVRSAARRTRTAGRTAQRQASTGKSSWSRHRSAGQPRHRRPTPGHTLPASPSGRTTPSAIVQLARTGTAVQPRQVLPRFRPDRPWWSPRTRSRTPTTWRSGADQRRARSRRAAPSDMIFSVPALIAKLSAILPLLPGRPDLHRHPRRRRPRPHPQRFLAGRRRARHLDRGHRRTAPDCVAPASPRHHGAPADLTARATEGVNPWLCTGSPRSPSASPTSTETAAYYDDFGLTHARRRTLRAPRDGGEQLGIAHSPRAGCWRSASAPTTPTTSTGSRASCGRLDLRRAHERRRVDRRSPIAGSGRRLVAPQLEQDPMPAAALQRARPHRPRRRPGTRRRCARGRSRPASSATW